MKIEDIIRDMINERLQQIAENLESQAEWKRDHAGSLEHAIANAFDAIREAIIQSIEESKKCR